jgi:hypothetical protein
MPMKFIDVPYSLMKRGDRWSDKQPERIDRKSVTYLINTFVAWLFL